MPIDALPGSPLPTDAPAVFDSKAYALLGALPTFVTQANALEANVDASEVVTVDAKNTAVSAKDAAVAAANFKGAWSSLTGALNIPASVSHNGATWGLIANVANVTTQTPGVHANWIRLTAAPVVNPGLVLLATLTPTAAANVDALTVFSSTYDDYLILMDGVKNATGRQEMVLRFAVAGTVDAGANYATVLGAPGAGSGGGDLYGWASNTNDSTGKGCSTYLHVANVNASVGLKTVNGFGWTDDKAGGATYRSTSVHTAYFANNAVSGIRFYWQGGSNFSAQGTIRIYGYSKT